MMDRVPFFSVRRNVVLTAVFYTFLWGLAFPLVKLCMDAFGIPDGDNLSKCLIAGMRFTLSGLLTILIGGLRDKDFGIPKTAWKNVLPYGLLATSIQYAFTYIGLSNMDGSKGAVFDQLSVFIVVLCSGLVFKSDKLTAKKVLGCALGFAGVLIINIEGLSFSFSAPAEGMMLLAALTQALSYFVAKGSADTLPAAKLVGYGQFVGGAVLVIVTLACGAGFHVKDGVAAGLTLAALVTISSAAYVLSLMPLKYFPVSEINCFNLLIVVFGVVLSAVVLGEDIFRWNIGVSLLLIVTGIICINRKEKKSCDSTVLTPTDKN